VPAFDRSEFLERRDRLLELMERASVDLALIASPANYYYLTGLNAPATGHLFLLALRSNGEGMWIGRRMEMSNVRALAGELWATAESPINDAADAVAQLADAAERLAGSGSRIGADFASPRLPHAGFVRLRSALSRKELVDMAGMVEGLRATKSDAEIRCLRRAGRIVGTAMRRALATLRPGMRDSDLAAALVSEAILAGSEPLSEGPYVVSGPRSFQAHASWTGAPIEPGEIVDTEMAAVVARYNTPVFRVSVLGAASDALHRFHAASLDGLRAGLDSIEPGMTSAQADAVVRRAIEKAGYGEYFTVRAAYGIGIGFPPSWGEGDVMSIRPGDQRILGPGMCFHLVPALYKAGLGCVCCSMPIVITDSGVEPLTEIEPKLFEWAACGLACS
jgi:Xaa-Pro dipeptidase